MTRYRRRFYAAHLNEHCIKTASNFPTLRNKFTKKKNRDRFNQIPTDRKSVKSMIYIKIINYCDNKFANLNNTMQAKKQATKKKTLTHLYSNRDKFRFIRDYFCGGRIFSSFFY